MPQDPLSALRDPNRLASLRRTDLLDTLPEDAFDRLIRLAVRALGVPTALVTLVDERRQFFKSCYGLPEPWASRRETPLSHSFCRHVAASGAPLVVADAREHPLLRESPAIRELEVVAYAGVPLLGPEGHALGSFAVIDSRPREWSREEVEVVRDLAALATKEIERRVNERERERAERRRAEAEAHLRRAERLASLATLLSGVAHELNNPLAAIKSFAQLLLLDPRPEEDREALEVVAREATRAAKIVADLRLVARQTQQSGGAREPVDLNDLVRHVLSRRGYTLQTHNVEVREELAPDLPPVLGDRDELEQVVRNLVLNAEHSVSAHPGERRLVLSTGVQGGRVLLRVADSGPGIPPEHLDRIFDPFWTTKEPGEGTGLGLSMVLGIVTEHGGEVRVESAPEKGAVFTVDLPQAGPPRGAPAPPPRRPLRILVVDDEPPIRRSLARYLERRGHRVDEAADGGEALIRLGDPAEARYDVILADLRMPGLSGDRLLEALREREGDEEDRLIFVTGDAMGNEAAGILATSGVPVILKPFDLDELVRVVEGHAAGGEAGGDTLGTRPPPRG